jgi:hypothetical protein
MDVGDGNLSKVVEFINIVHAEIQGSLIHLGVSGAPTVAAGLDIEPSAQASTNCKCPATTAGSLKCRRWEAPGPFISGVKKGRHGENVTLFVVEV